jgi:single-strand DNA-binding protein
MANDLNQCNFIGRLGRDPEMRYMPNGDAVANFSIAVGSTWTDKQSSEKKESTEWRKLGDICGEYLKKGSQVFVSGQMKTRKWKDKEGNDRYTTEVVLDRMQMLGSKPKDGEERDENHTGPTRETATAGAEPRPAAAKKPAGKFDDMEDDIPF